MNNNPYNVLNMRIFPISLGEGNCLDNGRIDQADYQIILRNTSSLFYVTFCQSMQKVTKKIFDGLNSFRLVPRLHSSNTPSKRYFLFKPSAASEFCSKQKSKAFQIERVPKIWRTGGGKVCFGAPYSVIFS
jgi:hypothetical protein